MINTFFSQTNAQNDSLWETFTQWLDEVGVQVLLVLVFVFLIQFVIGHVIKQAIDNFLKHTDTRDSKRKQTISKTLIRVVQTIIWIIGVMVAVDTAGYNIAPILTGAGVGGIIIGFGAQSLIKDFIAGMFIIAENQYRISDVVEINGITGKVEDINLRTTVLRDLDGAQHHIPNGSITHSTNQTMSFARININFGVGYESDIDKVEKVINNIGQTLADDEEHGSKFIEPIKFVRVMEFADSAIIIKALGKVSPEFQWKAEGLFRKAILKEFKKSGIEIPFPQITLNQPAKKPIRKKK